MTYEIGKVYEMDVIGIRRDNADKEFILVEDNGCEYRIYNIFRSQHDSLPEKLFVTPRGQNMNGNLLFRQDLENYHRSHYKIGDKRHFYVTECANDTNGYRYFELEDDYSNHRYYAPPAVNHAVGEKIYLEITGFTDKGFLQFSEASETIASDISHTSMGGRKVFIPESSPTNSSYDNSSQSNQPAQDDEYIELGDECETLELKSSIVFPPDNHGEADIEKQLWKILRTLTGFMNAQGGDLYIGVHNQTHKITGIESDYPHLNDDPKDPRSPYYENRDGFENKIRNQLSDYSQMAAQELISFEFRSGGAHEYCIIHVKQAPRPIWLRNMLYQRTGNSTRLVTGDCITQFVVNRMSETIKSMTSSNTNQLDLEEILIRFKDIINSPVSFVSAAQPKPKGEIVRWMIWKNDSTSFIQTAKTHENSPISADELFIEIPVSKEDNDSIIVFCYESGNVNLMAYSDYKKKIPQRSKEYKTGYYSADGSKPAKIFLAHPGYFLAGFSVDEHGIRYIKIHRLTDFRPTEAPNNKGCRFVPTNGMVSLYKLLPASAEASFSHLISSSARTSIDYGIPVNSVAYPDEIRFVAEFNGEE